MKTTFFRLPFYFLFEPYYQAFNEQDAKEEHFEQLYGLTKLHIEIRQNTLCAWVSIT